MKKLMSVAAVCILAGAFGAAHAGDATAGKVKATTCAGCHGMDGNSKASLYPKLANQHEQYLVRAMKDYKTGQRSDPTMRSMTAALSNVDIANLAAYFASQPSK